MFTAAAFTITKVWKQTKCPLIGKWLKQQWYKYTVEYHSAIEKKGVLPFATTWMDLECIMLSEVSLFLLQEIIGDAVPFCKAGPGSVN